MRETEYRAEDSLSVYSGRHTKVAIVAGGIDARHPQLAKLAGGIELAINKAGRVISGLGAALMDRAGHGTACAGIVHRIAPAAQIFSVRVCDEALEVDGQLLSAALRWALEQRVDIISLSLGCADSTCKEELAQLCRELVAQRVIVVTTVGSQEVPNYIAQFPDAIGVTGGQVRGYGAFYYRPGGKIECIARGDKQRVCWLERAEVSLQDSRFAVAHMAGTIALLREKAPQANLVQIRALMAEHAINKPKLRAKPRIELASRSVSRSKKAPPDPAKRVVLYPYGQEMQILVRFKDLLPWDIVGVAGPADKAWVGRDAGKVLGVPMLGLPIAANWPGAVAGGDMLVLGGVKNAEKSRDKLRECVQQALARNMHVFSFTSLDGERYADLRALAAQKGCRLDYPWVDGRRALAQRNTSVRARVGVPVLGIFSTSSCRASFALQLLLRRQFLRRGYRLRQVGTEPPSSLFGMDCCLPMGYGAGLCMPLQYYPQFIAQLVQRLCAQSPDLVLVGSPPGPLYGDGANSHAPALSSLAFLLGTRPDLCILACNRSDSTAHIARALALLRSVGNMRVLALAVDDRSTSLRAKSGTCSIEREEQVARWLSVQRRFLLPVVPIIGGEERLVELVEAHGAKSGKLPGRQRALAS
jgi:subtilisin